VTPDVIWLLVSVHLLLLSVHWVISNIEIDGCANQTSRSGSKKDIIIRTNIDPLLILVGFIYVIFIKKPRIHNHNIMLYIFIYNIHDHDIMIIFIINYYYFYYYYTSYGQVPALGLTGVLGHNG
jgi:hypothetical protein